MDTAPTRSRRTHLAVLALVTVVGAVLVFVKTRAQISAGPEWDTYAFLGNAADWAGKGFGYTEPHRAPLISILTALMFRFRALDVATIQWVDAMLSVSAVAAFYLLLRRRFGLLASSAGALGLLAIQPLWLYIGVGYTDLPSVALSLWLLLTLIKATEEHPAWYLLAGPLFVAAVLMRYTALLFAFPSIVWLLSRWRPFRQYRWLLGAVTAAIVTYLPLAFRYTRQFGDALFPFVFAFSANETVSAPSGEGQVQASGVWYLSQLTEFLAPDGFALLALLALLGAGFGLIRLTGSYLAASTFSAGQVVRAIAGASILVLSQYGGGLILRQLAIPVGVLMIWNSLGQRPTAEGSSPPRLTPSAVLDATMLTWFLIYLDFHGHQDLQVPRYIITMAPSLLYFILLGWEQWADAIAELRTTLASDVREVGPRSRLLVRFAIAALIGALVVATIVKVPSGTPPYNDAGRELAHDLLDADPGAQTATVYSDLWPITSWYMRTNVRAMPLFDDESAFAHELEKYDADYFTTIFPREFDSFEVTQSTFEVRTLARVAEPQRQLPRVQLLGTSWDRYLEQLIDYDLYLMSTAGRYGWEGSAFLDEYTAEELSRFDAVAAYRWRWRDRAAAEQLLLEYVNNGGALVLDASQNIDGVSYSVNGSIMFDTFITRKQAPANGTLSARGSFAEAHPELADIETAPFVDETGAPWTGASYTAGPGAEPLETLVTIGEAPAIQAKRIGKGTVYFIGYNLVWHAFGSESADEKALIQAVFEDAIERGRDSTDG